jgi:predicted aspartyl protease
MIKTLMIVDANIIEDGPIIDVEINVLDGFLKAPDGRNISLTKLEHIPDPINVKALIDTGTANCCIADWIVEKLALVEIGRKDASNALGQPYVSKMYMAQVVIPTVPEHFVCNGDVQSLPMKDTKFDCIIGRSILSHGISTYYGPENKFTLTFYIG